MGTLFLQAQDNSLNKEFGTDMFLFSFFLLVFFGGGGGGVSSDPPNNNVALPMPYMS